MPQVNPPGMFMHVESASQPPLLAAHSSTSRQPVVPLPVSDYTQLKACPTFDANTPQPAGCNVFTTSMVDTEFFSDFYDSKLVPELCVAAVQNGTPCTGQTAKAPLTQAEWDAAFPSGATSNA